LNSGSNRANPSELAQGRLDPLNPPAQGDLPGPVGGEPQPFKLPVTVLGRLGEHPLGGGARGPARQRHPLVLEVHVSMISLNRVLRGRAPTSRTPRARTGPAACTTDRCRWARVQAV
jgi:hypothetical protein